MEDEYLLSIIIPCFNSSKVLIPTLENIKSKLNKIEFVIVDDFSSDDSYNDIINYSKNSMLNISCFRNDKNVGPGESRNIGIEKSMGKYITFLDSDDYFEEKFYDDILKIIEEEYDCIFFNNYVISGNNKTKSCVFYTNKKISLTKENILVYIKGTPWGKVFKKSIIFDSNVKFLNQKRNEDLPFVKVAVSNCFKFKYIEECLYNYVNNDNSLMHNRNLLNPTNAQNAFRYILDNVSPNYKYELEGIFVLEYLYSTGKTNTLFLTKKDWKDYIKKTIDMFPNYSKSKYIKNYCFYVKVLLFLIKIRCYGIIKYLVKRH